MKWVSVGFSRNIREMGGFPEENGGITNADKFHIENRAVHV